MQDAFDSQPATPGTCVCKYTAFFFLHACGFHPERPASLLAQKWQGGEMPDCGVIWWPVASVCEGLAEQKDTPPSLVLSPQGSSGLSCACVEMNKIKMRYSSDSRCFKWSRRKPWIVSGSLCPLCWWNEKCIAGENFFYFENNTIWWASGPNFRGARPPRYIEHSGTGGVSQ